MSEWLCICGRWNADGKQRCAKCEAKRRLADVHAEEERFGARAAEKKVYLIPKSVYQATPDAEHEWQDQHADARGEQLRGEGFQTQEQERRAAALDRRML